MTALGRRWSRHWQSLGRYWGLFCLCCLLAISCGDSNRNTLDHAPQEPGRIAIGTTAKIRTLDPADAYELFTNNLLYNLGDRLYTYAPGTTTLKPQLAAALPQVSEDGLTYTIPLRGLRHWPRKIPTGHLCGDRALPFENLRE